MRRPGFNPLAAIALSVSLSACAYMNNLSTPSTSPSGHEAPQAYSRPNAETVAKEKETAPRSARPSAASAPQAAKPVMEAAPSATTVTLADEDAQKSHTEKLLSDSNARLAQIDRARLSSDDASTYQQAEGLVEAARSALDQRDYLLASGLAEKASVLANTIGPKPSSH